MFGPDNLTENPPADFLDSRLIGSPGCGKTPKAAKSEPAQVSPRRMGAQ
jgi:hypothetical protein